ncbi:MAG: lysophospholipase [Oenococcus sp.]|nr:lysophospholipase [Oenococcus kitaharae]MCV3295904.1 lysophospholipase [Oenococcus kitaharae]
MQKSLAETLQIECGGNVLYGVSYRQDDLKSQPTIILSHGLGETYRDVAEYARLLANNGFVSIVFDFSGRSNRSKSSVSVTRMSIFSEKNDLLTVIRFAQSLNYVNNNRLFLFGESQGGAVSAIATDEIFQQIAGLVLFYPAFVIPAGPLV